MKVTYLDNLITRKALRRYIGRKGSAPLLESIEAVSREVGCSGGDVMLQVDDLIKQGAASLNIFTAGQDGPYVALTLTTAEVAYLLKEARA